MKSDERLIARKNLDKKLHAVGDIEALGKPPRGWIKAIREALGMTAAQFGRRMGVSQPRALEIEKNELKGTLTLDTLERAAQALNCRLAYTLVPSEPLETMIESRAWVHAKRRLQHTAHSMSLEDQAVSQSVQQEALAKLVKLLCDKSGSELWEEP